MADISWSDVTGFAPQLVAITIPVVKATIVGHANESLEPSVFGGEDSFKYRLARLLLAAHIGQLQLTQAAGGMTSSETVSASSLSVSFTSASSGSALRATGYGEELDDMVNSSAAARCPIVV